MGRRKHQNKRLQRVGSVSLAISIPAEKAGSVGVFIRARHRETVVLQLFHTSYAEGFSEQWALGKVKNNFSGRQQITAGNKNLDCQRRSVVRWWTVC